MKDWDTRGLHREARDAFTTLTTLAEDGRVILDEITAIGECLQKMEGLQEVRAVSCNDSTWNPPVTSGQLKQFIRSVLETRRDDLRKRFNQLRLPGGKK